MDTRLYAILAATALFPAAATAAFHQYSNAQIGTPVVQSEAGSSTDSGSTTDAANDEHAKPTTYFVSSAGVSTTDPAAEAEGTSGSAAQGRPANATASSGEMMDERRLMRERLRREERVVEDRHEFERHEFERHEFEKHELERREME